MSKFKGLKAVLFDHDGTLVDSEQVHYQLWNEVLVPHSVQLSEADYMRRYAGMPTLNNAAALIAQFNLPVTVESLAAQKLAKSDAFLEHAGFPLMPGALAALHYFRDLALPLGVVTGAGFGEVRMSLHHHHLLPFFHVLISNQEVTQGKPAPDGYLLALQRLGVAPEEALAFEDTEHGVKAAHAAGIPVVALPNPMSARHDFSLARYVASSWQDAMAWVER